MTASTEMNISEIFPFASNIEFGYPSYSFITKDRFDTTETTREHPIKYSEKSDRLISRSELDSSNACEWAEDHREERGGESVRLPSGYDTGYNPYRTVV